MNAPTSLANLKGEERKNALANMPPKTRVAALLNERKGEIAKMLPSHLSADRLLKVATIAATTTPALLECEIPSLITAVGQCAMFGLEPNTVLGHAYMIPFNKNEKKGNQWETRKLVQVVIGYKGLIDLARRSGQIISITAHEVCEGDHFDYAFGLEEKLVHRPADQARGEVTHFYAYAKLKDGGTAFEVMSVSQVKEIRDASAKKNRAKTDGNGNLIITGPWADHFVEMGRKTVIRRLAKYLPLSVEFQKASAMDEASENGHAISAIEGEFTIENDGGDGGGDAGTDTQHQGGGDTGNTGSPDAGSSTGGQGPSFEDAVAAVNRGDYDGARDLSRDFSAGQRAQIETAITNHANPAGAGEPQTSGRRQRSTSSVE